MTQNEAEYFADLLATVTDDSYVAGQGASGDDYSVYMAWGNSRIYLQTRDDIRVTLENAIRQCKNGLSHL